MKRAATDVMPGERLVLPVSERDHLRGTFGAPAILVEYGDYECPYCAAAHEVVQALQQELGGRLCFAYRNFPLTNKHPRAEPAAEAAEAAGAQGKFWEMHDLLFENQEALEIQDLVEYAAEIELDVRRFVSEIKTHAHVARLREDLSSGVSSGVNGTPTFFINNVRYDGSTDFESMLASLSSAEPGK